MYECTEPTQRKSGCFSEISSLIHRVSTKSNKVKGHPLVKTFTFGAQSFLQSSLLKVHWVFLLNIKFFSAMRLHTEILETVRIVKKKDFLNQGDIK